MIEPATWQQVSAKEASRKRLDNLVPLAVVIAAGCEPCAKRMVQKALEGRAAVEPPARQTKEAT